VTPPFVDGMIAATALVNGLVLVTRSTPDFTAFAGLEVEDSFGAG
jgi:tRNA(fMet)-specific endonuclease VapC